MSEERDIKEFDTVADSYDDGLKYLLGPIGGDTEKYAEYKIQLTHNLIHKVDSIMDFGCGIGRSLEYFKEYFSKDNNVKLYGCDTSPESVEIARKKMPDATFYVNTSVDEFNKIEDKYDLIFLACVFHHIDPVDRKEWAEAIKDKLKPGGYIAVFEHNLLNPLTKRVVKKPENELDHEEWMLSHKELKNLLINKDKGIDIFWDGYVLFSPIRFKWTTAFEKCLKWFPLGAQHCVIVRKK